MVGYVIILEEDYFEENKKAKTAVRKYANNCFYGETYY